MKTLVHSNCKGSKKNSPAILSKKTRICNRCGEQPIGDSVHKKEGEKKVSEKKNISASDSWREQYNLDIKDEVRASRGNRFRNQ